MKQTSLRRSFLRLIVAGFCLLPLGIQAANIVLGTGGDTSYVILESGNLGSRTYEIRYDASSGPHDTKFLLDQILAGDLSLGMAFTNWGTLANPNYALDSITYNSVTESASFTPPFTYWAQWVAGGEAGYPTAVPVASGSWSYGSGISSPFRIIAPGSWDAFVFSDGSAPPSVLPVPETSSMTLAAAGLLIVIRRRRTA